MKKSTITQEIENEVKASKRAEKLANKKSYTLGQIAKSIAIVVVLLALGALGGVVVDRAIKSTIDGQVKAQVVSFTKELEAKK